MIYYPSLIFGIVLLLVGLLGVITRKALTRTLSIVTKEDQPLVFWFQTLFCAIVGGICILEAFTKMP